jgi:hypothetical protein
MHPKQEVMMKTQIICIYLRAVLAITAIVLYSTGCGDTPATVTVPSASAEAAMPTQILSTETPVATRTPSIAIATSASLPTSTWKDGWVDFVNGYYGYAIGLPPSAVVTKAEVNTIPGWAQSQTFDELMLTYPPGMCTAVEYQSAYMTIRVANWLGGEFGGPCSRTGIGAVHPVWTEEEVVVGGASYPATYGRMYESEAPDAKFLEEFYYVDMGDGAIINFGNKAGGWPDQAAYDQYLKDKEILLEILRSYRSVPRTELFCPEPAPTHLKVGGYAYVSTDSPLTDNNVRSDAGINQDLIGSIASDKAVELLEGPICNNSLQWWKVGVSETGLVGWTPEGDHESSWLISCDSKENCGAS